MTVEEPSGSKPGFFSGDRLDPQVSEALRQPEQGIFTPTQISEQLKQPKKIALPKQTILLFKNENEGMNNRFIFANYFCSILNSCFVSVSIILFCVFQFEIYNQLRRLSSVVEHSLHTR